MSESFSLQECHAGNIACSEGGTATGVAYQYKDSDEERIVRHGDGRGWTMVFGRCTELAMLMVRGAWCVRGEAGFGWAPDFFHAE